MEDKVLALCYDLLAFLVPVFFGFLIELLRRKLGTEKMQRIQEELAAKRELALVTVRFVEQVYKELHGEEKFNKAAEWLVLQAEKVGLRLTAEEVKGLIEAALRELKDEFGNAWAKTVPADSEALTKVTMTTALGGQVGE